MMFTPFAFIKQSEGPSVYEILLSNPGPDNGVCAVGPKKDQVLYTTDITFPLGSIIYTDPSLTTRFKGNNFFYSTYDTLQTPYNIYISIDGSGVIKITGECK
jgi:hypothetical protein